MWLGLGLAWLIRFGVGRELVRVAEPGSGGEIRRNDVVDLVYL